MKCSGKIKTVVDNRINVQMQKMGRRKINDLYIVNLSENTKLNCDISKFEKGMNIQIVFNGIVALSLPPQIYAEKIRLI